MANMRHSPKRMVYFHCIIYNHNASYNIPNGRYFLEVHSTHFVYESAFIDVYNSNKGTNVAVSKIHPISR